MTIEPIDVDVIDHGAIVPARPPTSSLVSLAAPVEDIVEAQRQYHAVCTALLDENDVQVIGKKSFKKRSAWNKLAVAFAISTEEVRTTHERDERGRIIRTECVVRATAPNGRVSDGIGACDLYERCCDSETCRTPLTWQDGNFRHAHCTTFPCKQQHFSNPQHDIPATAFTRASNRAKADLFGMGEVSAEEVSGDNRHYEDSATVSTGIQPGSHAAKAKNTDAMRRRIHSVSKKLGMDFGDAVLGALSEDIAEEDLDFAQCRKINDYLSEEEKRVAP